VEQRPGEKNIEILQQESLEILQQGSLGWGLEFDRAMYDRGLEITYLGMEAWWGSTKEERRRADMPKEGMDSTGEAHCCATDHLDRNSLPH
jgi:hypothetical protein